MEQGIGLVDTLVEVVRLMQVRFRDVFAMLAVMGLTRPPSGAPGAGGARMSTRGAGGRLEWRQLADGHIQALLQPHAGEFRVPVADVVSTLRLLTFSATHPHIAAQPLDPEEIVDRVLFGVLRTAPGRGEPGSC